jgi:hypothetical protein
LQSRDFVEIHYGINQQQTEVAMAKAASRGLEAEALHPYKPRWRNPSTDRILAEVAGLCCNSALHLGSGGAGGLAHFARKFPLTP